MATTQKDKGYQALVAGFNLYKTPGVRDALDELHISTCYSGVVVDGPAEVVSTADEKVTLAVGPEQAMALERAQLAIIESPVHGTSFRASVEALQAGSGEVSLVALEPFKDYIGRRSESRVIPVHPMLVRVTRGEEKTFGRVMDISTNALSAIIDSRFLAGFESEDEMLALDVWGEGEAETKLPDFSVPGTVLRAHATEELNPPYWKVVLSFQTYPALHKELGRYIARRQREVMVALERLAA